MTNASNITAKLAGGHARASAFVSSRRGVLLAALSIFAAAALEVKADDAGTLTIGGTGRILVSADGTAPFTYQWFKNGVAISGATSDTYTFANAQVSDSGSYSVSVTNALGSQLSDIATVTVSNQTGSTVPTQPVVQQVVSGGNIILSAGVSGSPAPSIQWQFNGVNIAGANSATYTINGSSPATAGSYTVVLTNAYGSTTSQAALVPAGGTSRLVNVSVRTFPGSGSQALIAGFVTAGGDKSIVIRGAGPALAQYTSAEVATNPLLSLFQGSSTSPMLTNEKWGGTTELKNLFTQLGAFAFSDSSNDTALSTTVQPNVYSAVVTGTGTGLALAEIYDANPTSGGRIVNLSARTQVGTGDGVLVAGFVISGTGPKQVLIRGIGPTLATYGVPGTLEDPMLDLYVAGNPTPIQSNDNWAGSAALTSAFAAAGAFPLSDANSKDAAMVVTLNPGSYSVILSGVGATTGVGLVEIYELP